MISLNSLTPAPGSRHRRKIVGRGEGSGHGGKGSTRGFKGQTARSGDRSMRPGFEGGQVPLFRRIPKRGFSNQAFRTEYVTVPVGRLAELNEAELTPKTLRALGAVRGKGLVKVLADGEITKAVKVSAHAFSAAARAKIEKAGGSATVVKDK